MKTTTIILSIFLTINSYAETIVRVPLFTEENKQLTPMKDINARLKLSGKNKLPEYIEIHEDQASQKAAHDMYWNLSQKMEDLGLELANDIPGGNRVANLETCYVGNPDTAVGLLFALTDSLYSDQIGLWGYKVGATTYLDAEDEATRSEMNDYLNKASALWKNWKSNDKNILIITHQSDDGDDVMTGIIKACK